MMLNINKNYYFFFFHDFFVLKIMVQSCGQSNLKALHIFRKILHIYIIF